MVWQKVRAGLLASVLAAAVSLTVRAEEVGRLRILFWNQSRQTIQKASRTMWPDILEWP